MRNARCVRKPFNSHGPLDILLDLRHLLRVHVRHLAQEPPITPSRSLARLAAACLFLATWPAGSAHGATAWGELGARPGELDTPIALAARGGFVYVADFGNDRVQKFTADGAWIASFGSYGSAAGEFDGPAGMALDAAGDLYVTDFRNHRVQKFTSDGRLLALWGGPGEDAGALSGPAGIAVDRDGNVLVADVDHRRVQKYTPEGRFLAAWDASALGGLDAPWAVAAGEHVVYVLDRTGRRMLLLDDRGRAVQSLLDDAAGAPWGVAVSSSGDLFVSDEARGRIDRLAPDGGRSAAWSSSESSPAALAVSGADLFVTDARRHQVLRLAGAAGAAAPAPARFDRFVLALSGPHPSAHGATLRFGMPSAGHVRAAIFDVHGRRVRELIDGLVPAGERIVAWDGRDADGRRAAAGVYFASARFEDGMRAASARQRIVVLP